MAREGEVTESSSSSAFVSKTFSNGGAYVCGMLESVSGCGFVCIGYGSLLLSTLSVEAGSLAEPGACHFHVV